MILEKDIKKLMNTQLFEHAFQLKFIYNQMISLNYVLFKHLVLVLLVNDDALEHHIHEVDNWLEDFQSYTLKLPNRKRLTYKEYYDNLFGKRWDNDYNEKEIKSIIDKILYNYNKNLKIKVDSYLDVFYSIKILMKEICKDLSNDNFYTIENYL